MAPRTDALLERMMALHPKVIDLSLDRMHRILDALGHPERRIGKVIHVAGTNGKGSTVAMIRAGLEAAGESVNVYTSPHLVRFHERIRVAGNLIDEDRLSEILDRCLAANGDDPITYFEITTAAAFVAFQDAADWTLLEVGLGGRLDATNVIDAPELCVITPVDLDHQQFLGDTIAEIAGEKAGILKPRRPCIVGPQRPEALEVIEARAARLFAPLLTYGQDWYATEQNGRLVVEDPTGLADLPLPSLPGPHQIGNAGMAVAALRHLGFRDGVLEAAVTGADWPGRLQRLRGGRLARIAPGADIWLDGGHNPAAGRALATTMATLSDRPLHLVSGMLRTKDVEGFFRPFAGQVTEVHAVDIPGQTATVAARDTAEAARAAGLQASTAASVTEAVRRIAETAPEARILICGSLYLAGSVLAEEAAVPA